MQLRIGGALVVSGVVAGLVAGIIAAADALNFLTGEGIVYAVVTVSLVLLGIGLALVAMYGAGVFPGIWARRGLKTLAAGLLFDAVLVALMSTPTFSGGMLGAIILPLIAASWITVIGFALTVLGALSSGGRLERAGWILVVAVIGLVVAGGFNSDALRPIGVGLGIVAGLTLAIGISGIGVAAIHGVQPYVDIPQTTS